MPEPKQILFTVGRAIDKFLTNVGEVAYYSIGFVIFIAVFIYAMWFIEAATYLGGLLWLALAPFVAVSYTHLDVYKRQPSARSPRIARSAYRLEKRGCENNNWHNRDWRPH